MMMGSRNLLQVPNPDLVSAYKNHEIDRSLVILRYILTSTREKISTWQNNGECVDSTYRNFKIVPANNMDL